MSAKFDLRVRDGQNEAIVTITDLRGEIADRIRDRLRTWTDVEVVG